MKRELSAGGNKGGSGGGRSRGEDCEQIANP